MARRSSSDTQIFNCCKLKKEIENGTMRVPLPEPFDHGWPPLYYFVLGDDAFAMVWKTIQQKTNE